MRQQRYEDPKSLLRSDRPEGSHNLQAKSAMLREAGLAPFAEQTRYRFGTSSRVDQIVNEVTDNASIYWSACVSPQVAPTQSQRRHRME
ncbi:YopT-type cysteine protease domain-containing protein [Bradyrhizobium sp. IAR9]|uniref:YopT-type cysteine protease domain-containing protein n=1 Tax=Bradyrhizobium sp. IAR9 TaxID=2663841 RepID=UPI0024C056B9|nr:YopT-type cysteine protease domain-containing protein [Bradyrhizobium sp. IAR9]